MAGKADFYADGSWNFYCDFCGAKAKSDDGMRTWDNFYVCKHHKEVRNPQDFVRGVRENQSLPWTRPKPPNIFEGINWTRAVADTVTVSEVVGKILPSKTIAESAHTAETIALATLAPFPEAVTTSENVGFVLVRRARRALNGSPLNSTTLG